jgi:hypothetical protein
MTVQSLQFRDNASLKGREDRYMVVRVRTAAILESWRASLFSFEWMTRGGALKTIDELSLHERDKRIRVERAMASGGEIDRPVLGIGILDNVEIGAAREVFLTLAAHGLPSVEVHIPRSAQPDFKNFMI